MQDKSKMIRIIKRAIKKYETDLKITNNNSSEKYKDLVDLLKSNVYNIESIDMSIIDDALSSSDLSPEEIIRLRNNISTYKKLLSLNKNGKTNYKLSENQISDILKLSSSLAQLTERKKESNDQNSCITKLNYLKSLLEIIEDKDNTSLISNIELIEEICNECQIDADSKKEIFYAILSYNQSIFIRNMKKVYYENTERLDIETVRELFREYDYSFDDLKSSYKDEILEYATLNNIKDVLEALKVYNFPKFDLKKDGRKLSSLLISSDRRTIEEIVDYSSRKGIDQSNLIHIIPALISESSKINETEISLMNDSCIITGRSEDYKKNIEFLASIGLDIRYIFETCRVLLVKQHTQLVSNYNELQEYGIDITKLQGGELVHPALTYLILNDFTTWLDQEIESNNEESDFDKTYLLRDKKIENIDTFNDAIEQAKNEVIYNKTIGNKTLASLEEYIDEANPIRYNFDGILISKPKVNRIYNILINKKLDSLEDSLLYAIAYNSLLTEEQFNKIKRLVKGWNK